MAIHDGTIDSFALLIIEKEDVDHDCADTGFHTGSEPPPDFQLPCTAYTADVKDNGNVIVLAG